MNRLLPGLHRSTSFLAIAGLVFLAACSGDDPGSVPAPMPAVDPTIAPEGATSVADADPAVGEQHFNQQCAACHQIGGGGLVGLAPSVRSRDFLALASDDFIRATIAAGRGGTAMVPRPDLNYSYVSEIIAYLRALKLPNPLSIEVDRTWKATGDVGRGAFNFAVFCAYCHGDEGQGYIAGGSGPGIGLPGFLGVASDSYIAETIKQGRVGTAMRSFDGAKGLAHLSKQDIDDIIVWLRQKG